MHPLISLICFIIFAAFISLGHYSTLVIGCVLLVAVWLRSKQAPSTKLWKMLKRMRVFYLSILLVYLWFSPGEIMFPAFDSWSPTYEGLYQAFERIFALGLLVVAVETFLRLTPRPLLLSGLYYLATPFVFFGLNRNQFIIRVILTLDMVSLGPSVSFDSVTQKKKQSMTYYFQNITQLLADKIDATIKMSVSAEPVSFELEAPPNKWQWLWPLGLIMLFWFVQKLGGG